MMLFKCLRKHLAKDVFLTWKHRKLFFVPDMHNYAYRNAHCQRVWNVTNITVATFKVLKLKLFEVGCNKIIILEEFSIF